jgi:hypothetical protein
MIKNKEVDYLNGLKVKNIKENGRMESSMELENIMIQMKTHGKKVFGNMVKE